MKNRLLTAWRVLTSKYFIVVTYDYPNQVWVNAAYKQDHKENELVSDIIESIWKQEYKNK